MATNTDEFEIYHTLRLREDALLADITNDKDEIAKRQAALVEHQKELTSVREQISQLRGKPKKAAPEPKKDTSKKPTVVLTDRDREILAKGLELGTFRLKDLAEAAEVSANAIYQRLDRLRDSGALVAVDDSGTYKVVEGAM